MPRPRLYKDNAEKQAAYRARHAERLPVRDSLLAAQACSLHSALSDAVRAKTNVLPPELLGRRADETLSNLIHYLRSAALATPAATPPRDGEGELNSERETSNEK